MTTNGNPVLLAGSTNRTPRKSTPICGHGGYEALRKALSMSPEQVIAEVKASGLRGRGARASPPE